MKLIERDTEPDKRGQHRPTREQLKPIIAATVGLRGIGPEKKRKGELGETKPHHAETEAADRETIPGPGMFARGPQPIAVGHLTEDQEEDPRPRVHTGRANVQRQGTAAQGFVLQRNAVQPSGDRQRSGLAGDSLRASDR